MAFPTGNLFARYEATLQTGVANLTQLNSIPDQSGNGYNLFLASTAGTYQSNIVNGKPAYYLGGSGYYQISSIDNAAISSADPQVSIAVIVNSNTAGGSRTWPFGTVQGTSTSLFAFTDGATNGKWGTFLRGASNVGQAYITTVDDTVWSVLTLVYNGSTIKTYLNGTEIASVAASGNQVMDNIRLGSIVNQNYEGYIAGAYIWKTGLDATARADFHSYVQDTYGITVSDYTSGVTSYTKTHTTSAVKRKATTLSHTTNAAVTNPADVPGITTNAPDRITSISAWGNYTLNTPGATGPITPSGFVYDTVSHGNPGNVVPASSGYALVASDSVNVNSLPFSLSLKLTGLSPNTTYYIRAFGTNPSGTGYGEELSFTTTSPQLVLEGYAATLPGYNRSGITANIVATGAENASERGFVASTSTQATPGNVAPGASGYELVGNESGSFGLGFYTVIVNGMSPETQYFVRAYAKDDTGYYYSDELNFTTPVSGTLVESYLVENIGFTNMGGTYPNNHYAQAFVARSDKITALVMSNPTQSGDGSIVYRILPDLAGNPDLANPLYTSGVINPTGDYKQTGLNIPVVTGTKYYIDVTGAPGVTGVSFVSLIKPYLLPPPTTANEKLRSTTNGGTTWGTVSPYEAVFRIEYEEEITTATVTKTHTTDANKRKYSFAVHTTSAVKHRAASVSHSTNTLKRKAFTKTHTTSAMKRLDTSPILSTDSITFEFAPPGITVELTHSTDALKRKGGIQVSHTTDSVLRKTNTLSHTTSTVKRKANTLSHTTNAVIRKSGTKSHTTNTLKRKLFTKSHSTDSLLRRAVTLSHSTNALKRTANTLSHSTSTVKRQGFTLSHATDTLKRRILTVSHATDALKRKVFSLSHTTDTLLRKVATVSHSTSANKRRAAAISHTTSANKRKSGLTRSHTTSANKRKLFLRSHTTSANLRKSGITLTHTTNVLKRRVGASTHLTDANKRTVNTLQHSTDTLKRTRTELEHSTDAFLRLRKALAHSTNALVRRGGLLVHETDALLRKERAVSHQTSANKRKAGNLVSHTTDANLKGHGLVSHATDTNKRKPQTRSHSTDAFLRVIHELAHTTDTLLRGRYSLSHSTDSNKRKAQVVSHSTSAFKRSGNVIVHTTDANKKKVGVSRFHTTDSLLRIEAHLAHYTDALLRIAESLEHTTSTNKRKGGVELRHDTDANKRRGFSVAHATSANKRKATVVSHQTDTNKRLSGLIVDHTTDALIRKRIELAHSTDTVKRKVNQLSHSTDANKRDEYFVHHSTSTVIRIAGRLHHSTDSNIRKAQTVSHSTSGYFFTDTGKKKVLIDGIWIMKPVRVLQNGVWIQKAVRYYNGTEWVKTVY